MRQQPARLRQEASRQTQKLRDINRQLEIEIVERKQTETTLQEYAARLLILNQIDRSILEAKSA